jgi:hypothetical protein
MRGHMVSLAAVFATAGLVCAIVAIGISSVSGTPEGSVLAAPLPGGGAAHSSGSLPACSLAPVGGARRLRVGGACSGALPGGFACVRSEELLSLSLRRRIDARNVFYLTVSVPDFAGPGVYPESQAFAQIFGPATAPRWTARKALVVVEPDGSIELGRAFLGPEPATPAAGFVALRGQARCSAGRVGLGARRH